MHICGEDLRGEGEAVWLQFGGLDSNKMQSFSCCLGGRWEDFFDEAPFLPALKAWARFHWKLKGNIHLALMGASHLI